MTLQIFLSPRQKNQQATKQLNSSSHKKTDGSSDWTTGRRMWAWRRTRGNRMVVGWLELIPYLGYWTVAPSFHVGTCLLAKMCVSQTKIETKQQPAVCKTDNTSCNICHVCNSRGAALSRLEDVAEWIVRIHADLNFSSATACAHKVSMWHTLVIICAFQTYRMKIQMLIQCNYIFASVLFTNHNNHGNMFGKSTLPTF